MVSIQFSCPFSLVMLQFSVGDLDKVGKRGKSICGPAFCLELLFGPANPDSMFSASSGDGYSSDD